MKIGITVSIGEPNESMYKNGILMNAIFLQKAMITLGHTAILLDTGSSNISNYDSNVNWDVKSNPIKKYTDVYKDMDVLIYLATSFSKEHINSFKSISPNKRTISYKCGNDYVIDMEKSIHPKETDNENPQVTWHTATDQIWYVPQQEYQNQDYYETIYDMDSSNVFPVPFIWDPMFIESEKRKRNYQPIDNKRLCVYEPNMNVVKFAMIPILITERSYKSGAKFDKLNVYASDKLMQNKYVKSKGGWLNYLNLVHHDKSRDTSPKIQFLPKYKVTDILYYNDVVISHQWENPLNYAYLDALYFEYPLIHNADLIKDAGYYYPDFKISKGSELLNWVITNHDDPKNLEEYREKNLKVLERYTINNKKMLESYDNLLKDLVNNVSRERKYNWKTNTTK